MIEQTEQRGVTIVRMAHRKANALDVELCRGLTERLERLRGSGAEAVVLTGTAQIFSAGVDLLRVLAEDGAYLRAFLPALSELFETVFAFPKPIVAAVNGHAIAGGCVLACATDRRVMTRGTGRIGVPELVVGVPFPAAALEIMRFTAPPPHFQALVYGGGTLSPDEAAEAGLVDGLAAPEDLLPRAVAVAEALCAIPAAAFKLTKRLMRQPVLERLASADPGIHRLVESLWDAAETREAMRSYVARTFKRG